MVAVAVQRVRDPVPEEETGGDGPGLQQQGRRRQRAAAAAAEEEGHRGCRGLQAGEGEGERTGKVGRGEVEAARGREIEEREDGILGRLLENVSFGEREFWVL